MASTFLPYFCIHIDADFRHLWLAAWHCVGSQSNRAPLIQTLQKMWTTSSNPNFVMPVLSVRTGLDLFLTVKAFPPDSEIIMSAINIPDMQKIVQEHGLKIVPVDVSVDTAAPKIEMLEELRSDKTVALLVTHLYGKRFDMDPVILFAEKYNLAVIEDCAECFSGFQIMGHPQSDIALFSFGLIKYYTSFGGAIAKIKQSDMYESMLEHYKTFPLQSHTLYLSKLLKYSLVYSALNFPTISASVYSTTRFFGIRFNVLKKAVVNMSRGFTGQLLNNIRKQPSKALLMMMVERQTHFSQSEIGLCKVKGDYMLSRLPSNLVTVGNKSEINYYWLFPVLVDDPDDFNETLYALGVNAYRDATQLNLIEPSNGAATMHPASSMNHKYPNEAKYIIDHVVYLPVNKGVPFHVLDKELELIRLVMTMKKQSNHEMKLPSKL